MNVERLEKLAEHLESGQLEHEVFDFAQFNNTKMPKCGTAGCAIGECPIVWPDEWFFDLVGEPTFKDYLHPRKSAEAFFDIDFEEAKHLFYSNAQKPELYGGKLLTKTATRYEVAANIREFIKLKQNEKD